MQLRPNSHCSISVVKYCDEYACLSMCLCVCLSVRIFPETHSRSLPILCACCLCPGSVLIRHIYDRPHRLSPGRVFFPIENALSAGKGGMGVHSAGEVCYLRLPCCGFVVTFCRRRFVLQHVDISRCCGFVVDCRFVVDLLRTCTVID